MSGTNAIDWGRACGEAAAALRAGCNQVRETDNLGHFMIGLSGAFAAFGIQVDRINIPASRIFGFRHPLYGIAFLTWYSDAEPVINQMDHAAYNERLTSVADVLEGSPYRSVVLDKEPMVRARAADGDSGYSVVEEIFAEGYVDYMAIGLHLWNGAVQPLGVASKAQYPDDLQARLAVAIPLISAAVDALYASYAAFHVARAYVGQNTGLKVLEGAFSRGATDMIRAGILFCDVRGFTAMSEQLGAGGVVPVMNRVFDCVGRAVERSGGEILKFIGDAVLSIFPAPEGSCPFGLADRMTVAVRDSIEEVAVVAKELNLPVAVGFGGHVGEVLYGNIGTADRLDFTVMGPAVNLASRLEGLCKPYGVAATFSAMVGTRRDDLVVLGESKVKGVSEPVAVYGFSESV